MKCPICNEEIQKEEKEYEFFKKFSGEELGLLRHLNRNHKYDDELPEEIVEVPCFGTPTYELSGPRGRRIARVWNEKIGKWQLLSYPGRPKLTEYFDLCPVCHTPMFVTAIKGSTYLACCSERCYEAWFRKEEEGGDDVWS